jgi:hypothetical protein
MNGVADIKAYINRYFSDDLQYDETPAGAMERNQLRKWMLYWAQEETNTKLKKQVLKSSKTNKFPGLF